MTPMATKARKTLFQKRSSRWVFDFSDVLLFSEIQQVVYSVISPSKTFFQHLARPPNGTMVVVETSAVVDAEITIDVVQGL
mmetsp:Transcript_33534/g.55423  ORF Transcript_33534/g.55423 Transcript_33534/m.55423 type:complete len:81 (+) Transcript_33534:1-243(+)